jgi:hypothetical protein
MFDLDQHYAPSSNCSEFGFKWRHTRCYEICILLCHNNVTQTSEQSLNCGVTYFAVFDAYYYLMDTTHLPLMGQRRNAFDFPRDNQGLGGGARGRNRTGTHGERGILRKRAPL